MADKSLRIRTYLVQARAEKEQLSNANGHASTRIKCDFQFSVSWCPFAIFQFSRPQRRNSDEDWSAMQINALQSTLALDFVVARSDKANLFSERTTERR
jgi:hypothetical protein